jgi:hypothetical protein
VANSHPVTKHQEVPVNNKRRVTVTFSARLATSRRMERFALGELLMLIENPDVPGHSRFMRLNGLRPNRGSECQYLLESEELDQKTEVTR